MSDTPLIAETLTPVGEASGATIFEVRTDTKITNTRHFMLLKDVPKATGLDPADVAQKASEAASDKVLTIDNERNVRLSTVRRWNLPNLQSADPEKKAQAQKFHQDSQRVLS